MSEEEAEQSTVKYPECTVELIGTSQNAVAIFRKVRRELIRYLVDEKGWTQAEAEKEGDHYQTEATSGDYDNVFATSERWVSIA